MSFLKKLTSFFNPVDEPTELQTSDYLQNSDIANEIIDLARQIQKCDSWHDYTTTTCGLRAFELAKPYSSSTLLGQYDLSTLTQLKEELNKELERRRTMNRATPHTNRNNAEASLWTGQPLKGETYVEHRIRQDRSH